MLNSYRKGQTLAGLFEINKTEKRKVNITWIIWCDMSNGSAKNVVVEESRVFFILVEVGSSFFFLIKCFWLFNNKSNPDKWTKS